MIKINILSTTDYKIFKHIPGNRPVDERHLLRLTSSIAKKNMLDKNPIIVNRNFEVIDGQHRLKIAEANNLEIFYVVQEDATLEDVQQLNTATKPWSMRDYLESYVALGNEDYIELKKYVEETGLSITNAMLLLNPGARPSGNQLEGRSNRFNFKHGKFKITNKEFADQMVDKLNEVKKAVGVQHLYTDREFITALMKLDREADFGRFMDHLEKSGKVLTRSHTARDYLHQMEDIYNYNMRVDRVRLY